MEISRSVDRRRGVEIIQVGLRASCTTTRPIVYQEPLETSPGSEALYWSWIAAQSEVSSKERTHADS